MGRRDGPLLGPVRCPPPCAGIGAYQEAPLSDDATAPEGPVARERPRVVRLVVVQTDVERGEDDEVLAANPRPRLRGDCGPLACPHCGKQVLMRLGEDERGLTVACPECGERVRQAAFGLEEWDFLTEIDHIEPEVPSPTMLNHCRPCPWVGCVNHLYLDVMDNGASIRLNFPSKEPWELEETCALDVAERDGATLDEVGKTINITRERVRQLIEQAFKQARKHTNTELFKGAMDIESVEGLPYLRHPLEDAE